MSRVRKTIPGFQQPVVVLVFRVFLTETMTNPSQSSLSPSHTVFLWRLHLLDNRVLRIKITVAFIIPVHVQYDLIVYLCFHRSFRVGNRPPESSPSPVVEPPVHMFVRALLKLHGDPDAHGAHLFLAVFPYTTPSAEQENARHHFFPPIWELVCGISHERLER